MKRDSLTQRLVQIAFLAIAAGIWYGLTATQSVSRLFLPPPDTVWAAFSRSVATGQFWSAVQVTLATIVKAYGIALILGVLTGYVVSRSRFAIDVLEPLIAGLFTVPITLLFPMFILFFGIGTGSKVAYGATYGFFPIVLNTITAFAQVDELYLRAARSMGASRWQTFRRILLPCAFPVLLTGLRIGFFISFASVLGGETLSSVSGVGRNISLAAELMEPARMYAWIVFVIFTAIALNMVLTSVENRTGQRGGTP